MAVTGRDHRHSRILSGPSARLAMGPMSAAKNGVVGRKGTRGRRQIAPIAMGVTAALLLAACNSGRGTSSSFPGTAVKVVPLAYGSAISCLKPCVPPDTGDDVVYFAVSRPGLTTSPACTVTAKYHGRVFGPVAATHVTSTTKGHWVANAILNAPNSLPKSSVTVECRSVRSA